MQAQNQKKAKKALKRQEKGTKLHQAHEIALMLGGNGQNTHSTSPSPIIDPVSDGAVMYGQQMNQ